MSNRFLIFILSLITIISCGERQEEDFTPPQGWFIMNIPVNGSIRGLSPLTEEIAWASGPNGVWMVTLDGGATWTHGVIDGMDTVDFRDIEAMNAATAVAISAGQPAVIYKTIDAGTTWKKVYEGGEDDFFNGMSFVDDKLGYAYGDPVDGAWVVLKTSDGGDTWTPLPNMPAAADGEAGFAASGSAMAAEEDEVWLASGGTESKVYYSKNRGGRWEKIETPMQQGAPSKGIYSLCIIDNRNLVAVGGDYENPDDNDRNVVLSHDDGLTWVTNTGTKPTGYRSGVTYFPRFHWVIAVGPNGSDYSTDGGENWERFSDEGFNALKLSKSGGSVWAAGSNGKIGRLDFGQ